MIFVGRTWHVPFSSECTHACTNIHLTYDIDTLTAQMLEMRKLKHREMKALCQGYTVF